jgi:nicotinate phosphoribosyltransferase
MKLNTAGCKWADFGTRRRRSYEVQKTVIDALKTFNGFVGTSNVHFAHQFGCKPIGTMAHEWIMGNSAMCGLRRANKYALENWIEVYGADLGIALTDTYGTEAFLRDFDMQLAKLFDGPRHDSGSPYKFADTFINHYMGMRIDPLAKNIVFSDGLDTDLAVEIQGYCDRRIGCSFGIGTHFTNDFMTASDPATKSRALNMVIKLRTCNGIEVVKLSDDEGKATGDKDAVRVAEWTHRGRPLD